MAYGLKAMRLVVETLAQCLHEQGLTAHCLPEEIFAPSTVEL